MRLLRFSLITAAARIGLFEEIAFPGGRELSVVPRVLEPDGKETLDSDDLRRGIIEFAWRFIVSRLPFTRRAPVVSPISLICTVFTRAISYWWGFFNSSLTRTISPGSSGT